MKIENLCLCGVFVWIHTKFNAETFKIHKRSVSHKLKENKVLSVLLECLMIWMFIRVMRARLCFVFFFGKFSPAKHINQQNTNYSLSADSTEQKKKTIHQHSNNKFYLKFPICSNTWLPTILDFDFLKY